MSSDDLNSVQPEETSNNGEPLPAADIAEPLPDSELLQGSEPLPMPQDQAATPPEVQLEEPVRAADDTPVPPIPTALNEHNILIGGELVTVLEDDDTDLLEPKEPDIKEGDTPVPPVSAVPPRIVAEAPLGGSSRPRPVIHSIRPEPKAPPVPAESAEPVSTAPTESESPAKTPAGVTPATKAELPLKVEQPEKDALTDTQPSAPTQPLSRVTVSESAPVTGREDWQDDDLSPELAAVLFGERTSKPKAAAVAPAETQTPAAAPTPAAKPAAPAAEPEAPAEPIALTDIAAARRMRLNAKGHSAAAPDTTLQGKMRYTRVEEPLSGDIGQRTIETWTYFKPDYPSLDGRLVQRVRSVEVTYADGSWAWLYERRYSDRGIDRRLVCASADRSYVERDDTVSRLDPQTGKRVKYHEDAAMILAAAERDEKRGLFAGLLNRDDDEQYTQGSKTWRVASASERRQARKEGGQAFPRRFLGIF